jgi:hypothetical protein
MFPTPELIALTRSISSKMGQNIDNWPDERVLELAASWGFRPVQVILCSSHGMFQSSQHLH